MTQRARVTTLLVMEPLDLNNSYSPKEQNEMLNIAAASITFGLKNNRPINIDAEQYSSKLQAHRATFITLERDGRLRGCIGSLVAHQSLVEDIASNAYSAAFKDPRFDPMTSNEFEQLDIHVSILSPAETMLINSEQTLLDQIQPGIDGLILTEQNHRATFLPSVWETLPDKNQFLSELKKKAGLSSQYWSSTIKFEKYSTFSFGNTKRNISV